VDELDELDELVDELAMGDEGTEFKELLFINSIALAIAVFEDFISSAASDNHLLELSISAHKLRTTSTHGTANERDFSHI
jgi:hypothetical protein